MWGITANIVPSIPSSIRMHSWCTIAPEILTRQIIILDERRVQANSVNIAPYRFFCEWRKRRLDLRVEQANHVVARLAIRECGLVSDVLEDLERECHVRCGTGELRLHTRISAFCAECRRSFSTGDSAVSVAWRIESSWEDLCAVVHCAFDCDYVGRCHEH
jgi:hypothetical protein